MEKGKKAPLTVCVVLLVLVVEAVMSKDLSPTAGNLGSTFPNGFSGVVVYSSLSNNTGLNYALVLDSIQEFDSRGSKVMEYVPSNSKWRNVPNAITNIETDITLTPAVGSSGSALTNVLRFRAFMFTTDTNVPWGSDRTTFVGANTLRFIIDINNWPYVASGNYLVVNMRAYSNKLNTTLANQPEQFINSILIQGLAGKEAFSLSFETTVLDSVNDDLLSYSNAVLATDSARISLQLPADLQFINVAMNVQLTNATRLPDSIAVANDKLRAYYQAQLWSVALSPAAATDYSSFNLQYLDLKEVDTRGNVVQSVSFSDVVGRWWGPYNLTKSVVSVNAYGSVSVGGSNATTTTAMTEIGLETSTYAAQTSTYNLNEEVSLSSNSFKWTLDIINWPFLSDTNTLIVTQRIPLSAGAKLSSPSANTWTITQQSGASLLLKYPDTAVIDSTPSSVAINYASNDKFVDITLSIPRFYSKISYDPTAQVFESEVEQDIVVTTSTYVVSFPAEQANLVIVNFKDTGYTYTLQLNALSLTTQTGNGTSVVSQTTFSRSNTAWTGPAVLMSGIKRAFVNVTLHLNSTNSDDTVVIGFLIEENDIYWTVYNSDSLDDSGVTLSVDVFESTSVRPPKVSNATTDDGDAEYIIRTTPLSSLYMHLLSANNVSTTANYVIANDRVSFNFQLSDDLFDSQFLHLFKYDTRSGGGCDGDARVVATELIQVTMANGEQGAKIIFDPIPVPISPARTAPQYTFELVSLYELQGDQRVQEVPMKWWDASCFGPYNVTVDISHLRSQYSYIFPGAVYPTTIDFNGFLHSQATIVVNQEEQIAIGDDSFKFDIDIRNWPFQNTSNKLVLEFRMSSNRVNHFVPQNLPQQQYTLEGNNGHDSFVLVLPRHQEIDFAIHDVEFGFSQPDPDGAGVLQVISNYFEKRMFYDPTIQIKHTIPVVTRSTDNLVVQMFPNQPSLVVTGNEDLLTVREYYFTLVDITEITTGPNPVVLQTSNYFKGGWFPLAEEQVNYVGYAELPGNVHVKMGLRTQLYMSGATVTYGNDTIETRSDSMGVDINVFNWPWARPSGSQLRVHFRITFFDFDTNETEVWFHKVGSDRFMDYMHVEGGVHNEKILQIKFPRTAVLDGVNKKLLGSIHIVKSSPSVVDLSFLFPHFDSYMEYNPIIYVAKPSIEWILGLVLAVIGFTLIMAGYAIVHKIKRYQSLP
eukprot:TRINITY_DN1597_c0_g3_i1.p1 TRINITY_DN1597_c0_g3~~TRINITY_DN1597_c0_g3_i1.p1  ORF type:complete len:1205 (-),score=281.85 TRINITY_DN1597_c0_g3_i1:2183-5797(-)